MPVVTVTAAPLGAAEPAALGEVASAVAAALDLRADDVAVSCVHASCGVLGTRVVDPWPVVVLHGRQRDPAAMAAASAGARTAVARAWARPGDEVWTTWLVTT